MITAKDIDTLALEGRDTTELLKVLPGFATSFHLPGGAMPLTAVTRGKQVLAIGARNRVYLSNDGGTTWTSVRVPWKSRAVKAEVVSYSDKPRRQKFAEARGETSGGLLRPPATPATPTAAPLVMAQNLPSAPTGSLVGTVTDTAGGVIPHATITLANPTTHATRKTETDGSGQYRVDGLAPGAYDVVAQARGFEAAKKTVQLAPTQENVANFPLVVGAETLTVTVAAEEQMIPTISPTSNEMIGGKTAKPIAAPGTESSNSALPDHDQKW